MLKRRLGVAHVGFPELFQQDARRDKFLSRLFALFSEDIVRCWCQHEEAQYENLGRPYLRASNERYGKTLDFTLRSRNNPDLVYIAELRCELEFEGYRYLCLREREQIAHHLYSPAFQRLVETARNPTAYRISVGGRPCSVSGAILIWGCLTPEGRGSAIQAHGFADVLSVKDMVNDMLARSSESFARLIEEKVDWCTGLFSGLLGTPSPEAASGVPVTDGRRR